MPCHEPRPPPRGSRGSMTEYGRGPGSEPWHPEDPLYGDQRMGRAAGPAGEQSAYGGQPQHSTRSSQQPQAAAAAAPVRHGATGRRSSTTQQYQPTASSSTTAGAAAVRPSSTSSSTAPAASSATPQQGHRSSVRPGTARAPHAHGPYGGGPAATPTGSQQPRPTAPAAARLLRRPRRPYPPPSRPTAAGARRSPDRSAAHAGPEPERQTDWDPGPTRASTPSSPATTAGRRRRATTTTTRRDAATGGARWPERQRQGQARSAAAAAPAWSSPWCSAAASAAAATSATSFYQDRFGPAPDFAGEGTGGCRSRSPRARRLTTIGRCSRKPASSRASTPSSRPQQEPQGQADPGRRLHAEEADVRRRAPSTLMLDPKSAATT